jgi:hypothetical protein
MKAIIRLRLNVYSGFWQSHVIASGRESISVRFAFLTMPLFPNHSGHQNKIQRKSATGP